MENIIMTIVAVIAGFCCGISSGLGFWPKYTQPKNIRTQFKFAIIGIVLASALVLYIQLNLTTP